MKEELFLISGTIGMSERVKCEYRTDVPCTELDLTEAERRMEVKNNIYI